MDQLIDKAKKILEEVKDFRLEVEEDLEKFKMKFLVRKGMIKQLASEIKNIPADQRKEFGQLVNRIKEEADKKIKQKWVGAKQKDKQDADLTLPPEPLPIGARHPLSIVRNEIIGIFSKMGFVVSEGPEIVDDWHNFTALNMPENHPARDMQDTYFVNLKPDMVLRTHTSSVQVSVMQSAKPPIRTISPGRVYRNETISARAHCQFHQVEGLYIDEDVSFGDLKQTLYYFATEMFGEDIKIRFRPSYFPFTEPSAELDISCLICKGKGCPVCKNSGWVEILGCGMVDPAVLDNCKIDSKKYTGFAFGLGIERITMLKYQIKDIRLFFENDIRFLKQFTSASTM